MPPNLADDRDLGERLLELLRQPRSPLADVLDAQESGAPFQVWPSAKLRDPWATAS